MDESASIERWLRSLSLMSHKDIATTRLHFASSNELPKKASRP
jgi:hypothetical protein